MIALYTKLRPSHLMFESITLFFHSGINFGLSVEIQHLQYMLCGICVEVRPNFTAFFLVMFLCSTLSCKK